MRRTPETSAEAATKLFRSTRACFRWRSICGSSAGSVAAMIDDSTRMALARLRSTFEFMSLVSVAHTMITSSGDGLSSFRIR